MQRTKQLCDLYLLLFFLLYKNNATNSIIVSAAATFGISDFFYIRHAFYTSDNVYNKLCAMLFMILSEIRH